MRSSGSDEKVRGGTKLTGMFEILTEEKEAREGRKTSTNPEEAV